MFSFFFSLIELDSVLWKGVICNKLCLEMDQTLGTISGSVGGSGRRICFAAEVDSELPRQLHRAPTPYPKELRNLARHARNLHHQTTHDQKVRFLNNKK